MQKIDEKDRAEVITFLRNRRDNLAQMLPLKKLRRYEDLINQIALEALESDFGNSSTVGRTPPAVSVLYVGNGWWTTDKGELFYRPLTEESMFKVMQAVEAKPAPTGLLRALMGRKKQEPLCNHERLKVTETLRGPLYRTVRRVECEICGWHETSHIFGDYKKSSTGD